jgi:hypothetical protein
MPEAMDLYFGHWLLIIGIANNPVDAMGLSKLTSNPSMQLFIQFIKDIFKGVGRIDFAPSESR